MQKTLLGPFSSFFFHIVADVPAVFGQALLYSTERRHYPSTDVKDPG